MNWEMEKLNLSLLVVLLLALSLSACRDQNAKAPSPCAGKQWEDPSEALDCRYPSPPIGRWHAVYTEEFAQKHDLPKENISTDLSPSVDYMEMDVQPYGSKPAIACMVNMLVKKPNDIALYNGTDKIYSWEESLNSKRKHIHHLNIDTKNIIFQTITTFGIASRHKHNRGFRRYAVAFYSGEVIEGYDYVTAKAPCKKFSLEKKHFPHNFAWSVSKASVWGKTELKYKRADHPNSPKGKDFYRSRILLNIPEEIIETVFKDVPVGGR